MRSCRDVSTGEVAVETAQLAPKMSTTIMPVDLPPTHSPCKNATYALCPCNLPRTDNSTPIRDAYSHNCRFNYYRTGCWGIIAMVEVNLRRFSMCEASVQNRTHRSTVVSSPENQSSSLSSSSSTFYPHFGQRTGANAGYFTFQEQIYPNFLLA